MPARRAKLKFLSFFLTLTMVLAIPISSEALMAYYTRGPEARRGNYPNRFNYIHPIYRARKPKPKRECKPHGQARCLQPKKQKTFIYVRLPQGAPKIKVHPYLRKVYQPKVRRIR